MTRRRLAALLTIAVATRLAWAVVAWWAWRDLDHPAVWAGNTPLVTSTPRRGSVL